MRVRSGSAAKVPFSLRAIARSGAGRADSDIGLKVTVACLAGAASVTGAEAQQTALPGVTVDAPVIRSRPAAAARPSAAQTRARAALRQRARERAATRQPATPAPSASLPIFAQGAPDGDPYANPAAPYKAERLASPKFTEPLVNQPRTVTVLTKEVLQDKGATSLRDALRTTAGVTMGSGEGGNSFGDRFFIRGFDARNDVFVDGIRDVGVSVRENFFTEQIEILKGPASSFAGRGTAGGALNIITKQASLDKNFRRIDSTLGTDRTKRVTVDINQVVNDTFAFRVNGLVQGAGVAGRDNAIFDNRYGGLIAFKWRPTGAFTLSGNYVHVDLDQMPDFGVPYYRPSATSAAGGPVTEYGAPRTVWYGFANRDFQKVRQDFGTLTAEWVVNPALTVSNRFRYGKSILNYVGTLPQGPVTANANPALWTVTASAQSRYTTTETIANQTDATIKFDTGPVKNTTVVGAEFSSEKYYRNNYSGLQSEVNGVGQTSNGALTGVNIFSPQFTYLGYPNFNPALSANPTYNPIDTGAGYVIHTANYQDFIILNGGVRYDDYTVTSRNNTGSTTVHSGLVNWNAGLTVKPLPNASVYAAYATSSNPVGAEVDGSSPDYGGLPVNAGITNQVFGPERNYSYEVGTKWELFDQRMLATAALFQTDKENVRETVGGAFTAGAAYRVRGVEFGLAGKITDQWSVYAGLVLLDSDVTKSNAASANPTLYPTNVGRPLANIAHQSFNLLTKYRIDKTWEVGGQATYMSKIYGGTLAANVGTSIPDHWRFDGFLEAKLNETLTAKIAVNNIFNELYYDALYRSGTPFVAVATGRSAYFTLTAKF